MNDHKQYEWVLVAIDEMVNELAVKYQQARTPNIEVKAMAGAGALRDLARRIQAQMHREKSGRIGPKQQPFV